MSRTVRLALASLFFVACAIDNDPPTGPTTGSITVSVTTTGDDAPAGYTAVLDGTTSRAVDADGSVNFTSVPSGTHSVELTEVPVNCTVTSANPATASVTAGGSTPITMPVECSALVGAIQITAATGGFDLDPDGYLISVDEGAPQQLEIQGSITIPELETGDFEFTISDVRGNCEVADGTSRSVTVLAGATAQEAFNVSCDWNSRIAFVSERNGNQEIYAMNPDGTEPINLTNHPAADMADDYRKLWSPDGSQIAFTSAREGSIDVYVVDADGSDLVNMSSHPATDIMPAWSPDGSRIAFRSSRDSDYEIFIANVDGTGLSKVANGSGEASPSWSPDGTRLAVSSYRVDANSEIFTSDLDGANALNLSNHLSGDWQPVWSPDGTRIAFLSNRNSALSTGFEIFMVNADGSGMINLSNGPEDDRNPAWSPDGTRIAFQSTRDGNEEIYIVNADGSGLVRLTNHQGNDGLPTWSPDGALIAFRSTRDGYGQIYQMSADGSGLRNLTDSIWFSGSPSWSPYLH